MLSFINSSTKLKSSFFFRYHANSFDCSSGVRKISIHSVNSCFADILQRLTKSSMGIAYGNSLDFGNISIFLLKVFFLQNLTTTVASQDLHKQKALSTSIFEEMKTRVVVSD